MARKSPPRSRSGVLFGLLLGVIVGLAAAVAVALFVTNAPVPFVDKASRTREAAPLANVREAPDPNRGLGGGISTPPPRAQTPPPNHAARDTLTQDIDQLIARLSQNQAAPRTAPTPPPATGSSATPTLYYLQAGAFRSEDDAEALKARILMLGLNGFVQPVQIDGVTLHRVRVGPFRGIDDMNRSRIALGKGNISSAVVRP